MDHARDIISSVKGTAADKNQVLKDDDITVSESPADIGVTPKELLGQIPDSIEIQ